ncbi:MAG: hypothetical protein ACLRR3_13400 [Eubacterium sp.]
MALELDKIVDTNNATLIKIATPTNDYENKKDIIYFGSKKPISNDLVVTGNKINWLDAKLTGGIDFIKKYRKSSIIWNIRNR